ncbi:MAG: hypothetical protein U1E25_11070 [Methylocystis sp.]
MSEKPTLTLIAQPTLQDLMRLFTLITGREPTPEELDEVRAEWAKFEEDEARAEMAKLEDDDDR